MYLTSDFNDMCDNDRCIKSFNKSAVFLPPKFYHADVNVELLYLANLKLFI